ncbi:MAG: low-specificity L-threonine aldolase [Planctomycetes bacterium]|nr:low-specificity L-threonine aldolase [Planctomycetota bacterium]
MVRLPVDLRSDTTTRPTQGMRAAMAAAEVGDDVWGEDPTVIRLQQRIAELLGKEAALYVPSGTMSNQIGVRLHCHPGDEVILDSGCHIYNHEQGGVAQLSGVATRTIDGECGVMRLEQLQSLIRPDNQHYVRTRLICIENTHNRGGGRVQPIEEVERICAWAHDHKLATHLDGARLFNAHVATGVPLTQLAAPFDTVSVCFSKGLGAPVGSAICGPHDLIARAVRHRKLFGGAMRQAGILAAGALYALEHHVERLAEDHYRAKQLAGVVEQTEGLSLRGGPVETNIVFIEINPKLGTALEFAAAMREAGVFIMVENSRTLRAVTHLDISDDDLNHACHALRNAARGIRSTTVRTPVSVYG